MKNLEIAYLLGAVMIEKHFTHDKTLKGNDHYHAMDKKDMARFNKRMQELNHVLGDFTLKPQQSESLARENARRSLVAATDIKAGESITDKHLTWKRPASGISPADIDMVIGQRAKVDIREDDVLQWELIN
jgi:N-acetylneuraminate synthase